MTAQSGNLVGTSGGRAMTQLLRRRVEEPGHVEEHSSSHTWQLVCVSITAGLVTGALLVLLIPFVAALAALAVAAVGIGLSEAELRGPARVALCAGLGLLVPALVGVIARMVGLL